MGVPPQGYKVPIRYLSIHVFHTIPVHVPVPYTSTGLVTGSSTAGTDTLCNGTINGIAFVPGQYRFCTGSMLFLYTITVSLMVTSTKVVLISTGQQYTKQYWMLIQIRYCSCNVLVLNSGSRYQRYQMLVSVMKMVPFLYRHVYWDRIMQIRMRIRRFVVYRRVDAIIMSIDPTIPEIQLF